jgi:hypothetical protein
VSLSDVYFTFTLGTPCPTAGVSVTSDKEGENDGERVEDLEGGSLRVRDLDASPPVRPPPGAAAGRISFSSALLSPSAPASWAET